MRITDTDRLNFLETLFEDNAQGDYSRVILRRSVTGRGMRLHHVRHGGDWGTDYQTIRGAIDAALDVSEE